MGAVRRGEVDAGVIIHESRFTYRDAGLVQLLDLGEWWEGSTGHPIPLGGIVARRSLGPQVIAAVDRGLRASVDYAFTHRQEPQEYIRAHAQELSEEVCAAHIALYVNDFSRDLGEEGSAAVTQLLDQAVAAGLVPRSTRPLLADP